MLREIVLFYPEVTRILRVEMMKSCKSSQHAEPSPVLLCYQSIDDPLREWIRLRIDGRELNSDLSVCLKFAQTKAFSLRRRCPEGADEVENVSNSP